MRVGSLVTPSYPFEVHGVNSQTLTSYTSVLKPGDLFVILDIKSVYEINVLEVQILFENCKMWFNIHKNSYNIEDVRRAGSYDIPFMTLQEPEPGSKLAL